MGIVQQIPRRDDRSEIRDSAWPASMCVCSTASEHPAQGLGVMGLGFKGVGLYSDQPGVDLNRLNPVHYMCCTKPYDIKSSPSLNLKPVITNL